MSKSLYDILELEEDASANAVKNAYCRLKTQHEQQWPETDERHINAIQYQAICEAYTILSNPKRRDLYDQRMIASRQNLYLTESKETRRPLLKIILAVCIIAASLLGYSHYQRVQAENARELRRLELEREQVKLKQEELRLAAEKTRQEREQMRAQQLDNYQRERQNQIDRSEASRYAAEERRRRMEEQRESARLEQERQRNERQRPIGPTYIMR